MKILILGSTGRTGKWLVPAALEKGYEVNCLVRKENSSLKENKDITLFKGSPIDKEILSNAMEGCDALVNALNISRTSDFPWAKLRTPETFLSDVMKNILDISDNQKLKRIVVCTAWGVNETKKDLPWWFRIFIDNSNIGVTYRDHEVQEDILEKSSINWTIVRPVGLTNSTKPKSIKITYKNSPKPSLTISRKSVAEFMIQAIEKDELFFKKPVISNE